MDVSLEPAAVFEHVMGELTTRLAERGLGLEPAPDGRLTRDGVVIGRVVRWEKGSRCGLEWRPTPWASDRTTALEIRVEAVGRGARASLELRDWDGVIGEGGELLGWFASEVAAPLLASATPQSVGDWLTDRQARRPSGARSRSTYRDPLFHYPNFHVILAELALTPDDDLLEVGCGGGAFLGMALESGCRAAAVDHSPDMVEVARELNQGAVAEGRLEVVQAKAHTLPFPDGRFTCAVMTGVLGFLTDPVAVLREMHRALGGGGRVVILGSDPELRGTPAAPEPMASRLRFYDEDGLEELGRAAGFSSVRAVWREMEEYARLAGVPEEALPLFSGPGGRFLLARKD